MNTAPKFTFDTEFQRAADRPSPAARARQRRTLTTEELETMCAGARSEGENAPAARAAEDLNRHVAALIISLRAALDGTHAEVEGLREETARLALGIAAKLAPAAIAALPAADVETALREMLHQAIAEPRVTLSAAPDVVAALEPRLKDIAQEEHYEGRIILNPDPALGRAECRIEWRGGGAARSDETIDRAIEALMTHRFSQSESVKG